MIFIGSDHAGFKTKEYVKKILDEKKKKYSDEGTYSEGHCDYPFYAKEVAGQVIKTPKSKGILICGTGLGMSMAANKVKGIRAALVHNEETAELSRAHNDANILVLSSRTSKPMIKKIVDKWFSAKFSNAKRHKTRISMLDS